MQARLDIILAAAVTHVGSVRAAVQKVIMTILKNLHRKDTLYVLDRVMDMFPEVPTVLQSGDASQPSAGASFLLNNYAAPEMIIRPVCPIVAIAGCWLAGFTHEYPSPLPMSARIVG